MENIVLICLPPALTRMPSPALSVLKYYLTNKGIKLNVIYWNLILDNYVSNFLHIGKDEEGSDLNKLLPFFSYLAIESNDNDTISSIVNYILLKKPQYCLKGKEYIEKKMYEEYNKLNDFIESEINSLNIKNVKIIGFSAQFYQWVPSIIVGKIVKKINPQISLFVGGFGTPNEACAFLRNFKCFDFSSWGEGENTDLLLFQYLLNSSNISIENIPHLSYRKDNDIVFNSLQTKYVRLDSLFFDFTDYIKQSKNFFPNNEIIVPIETGRGCHWNRCHFCYLNLGYKFRRKCNGSLIDEIQNTIKNYRIFNFEFLDNDLIGNDLLKFDDMLNNLIQIKESNENFSIKMAEIITKDVSYQIIKKMKFAGFESVQIGYESPSDNLLRKISKKNTFASNLHFIKWATEFGIQVSGANVIRNLIEETDSDINEGIDNIKYLRFYISGGGFFHNYSNLAISSSSKYLKRDGTLVKRNKWVSNTSNYFPKKLLSKDDRMYLFYDFVEKDYNHLWDVFSKIEQFYRSNKLSYNIIKINENQLLFEESLNSTVIKKLEFDVSSIYWEILEKCNYEIQSLNSLMVNISMIDSESSLKEILKDLSREGLLFCSNDYKEIISIIDVSKAK